MKTQAEFSPKTPRKLLVVSGSLWVSLLIVGFGILDREEFTPVATIPQVATFPRDSSIHLAQNRPTLLFFAHPHCPCTHAGLDELDGLLACIRNKVFVILVFTIPPGVPSGWEKGDLLTFAENIPEIRIFRDQGGKEATRLGVMGSGHVLLYASSGKLLFSGGITPSRGHEGDNPGRSAIISFVLNGHALVSHTPVYGCSLL